jgi:hypothetical protein
MEVRGIVALIGPLALFIARRSESTPAGRRAGLVPDRRPHFADEIT